MSDNSDSDILPTTDNHLYTPILQKNNKNLEASFEPFEFKDIKSNDPNSNHKQIRIVPNEGASASELRSSLKHALHVLDRMQTLSETEVEANFNRNMDNLLKIDASLNQQQIDLSKSDKLAQPRNYKIVRRHRFVPYKRQGEEQKYGSSQDRTEVSLFVETSEKIERKNNNNNKNNVSTNLNLDHFPFATRDIDLTLDEDQNNNIDLDELANSLGFNLEVSEPVEEGEETDTRLLNVSDFLSENSQRNPLLLGDRMKMLEKLITIAEGDLNNLNDTQQKEKANDNMS